jgi:hypothetical protein
VSSTLESADEFRFGGAARFLIIGVSLLLGVATHVVWDSFTHSNTWAWREFLWLHQRVHIPFLGNVPGYSILQYGSTFAGMLALAIWVWLWYRNSPAATPAPASVRPRLPLALVMLAIAGGVGLTRAALVVGAPMTRARANPFFVVFAATTLAVAFWQILLYCVLPSAHYIRTHT